MCIGTIAARALKNFRKDADGNWIGWKVFISRKNVLYSECSDIDKPRDVGQWLVARPGPRHDEGYTPYWHAFSRRSEARDWGGGTVRKVLLRRPGRSSVVTGYQGCRSVISAKEMFIVPTKAEGGEV